MLLAGLFCLSSSKIAGEWGVQARNYSSHPKERVTLTVPYVRELP
jgi:hypothetical protein